MHNQLHQTIKPISKDIAVFRDRREAGQKLALALKQYKDGEIVVYALPRGGVPVAAEVARYLHAPLDLIVVRKIGHPYQPEYAIGAIAINGHITRDRFSESIAFDTAAEPEDEAWFYAEAQKEQAEAVRRRKLYLGNRKPLPVAGKIAIVVDDGLATGLSMKAAIRELRHAKPAKIIAAVPIAPIDKLQEVAQEADLVVALEIPEHHFTAVSSFYQDFHQVSDQEVMQLLKRIVH